jgi:predicted permease
MRISLPQASYPDASVVVAFYDRLLSRVRALPGVTHAGAIRSLPLADTIGDFGLVIEGLEGDQALRAKGDWQIATDGYFEAMGERLIRGRWFTSSDRADTPLAGVINETMASVYWPGRDPIGQRFKAGRAMNRPWVTVVGIVGDVRHNGITAQVKEKFYVPHAQWSVATQGTSRSLVLTVRTPEDPARLVDAIRGEVRAMDPTVPLADVRTMEEVLAATTATPRFAGSVLGTFAAIALLLAAVGVYGVLSYVVARRTREIGVRMALGAEPGAVRRMVLRQGLTWGATGAAAGVVLALLGARLLRSIVYGISPTDPATFAGVLGTLLVVALLAAALPARRATRVDPMACLKAE